MTPPERYFLSRDCSSHWYIVPVSKQAEWDELTQNDIDDDDYESQERFEDLFGKYLLGGPSNLLTFENPLFGGKPIPALA